MRLEDADMPKLLRVAATLMIACAAALTPVMTVDAASDASARGLAKCNAVLASIPKVSAAQVSAFVGNSWVLPLCNGSPEMRAAKLDSSKVNGLINAIAGNAGLMKTLKSKGFSTDKIVGFSISVDGARIYVHG